MQFLYGYYYYGYYAIDQRLLILMVAVLLLTLLAQFRVKSSFKRWSQVRTMRGMTGADAARAVLRANDVNGVKILPCSGSMTDHYDPRTNTIHLSETVYGVATPAAVGVAAHEAGHAVQYAQNYLPIKLRAAIVPVTNLGSKLAIPLVILGVLLMGIGGSHMQSDIFYYIALAGVGCYSLCVLFQLITLPTEYNASRRARRAIAECGLLTEEEQRGAGKVLSAAALTYVAALASSLVQLLRLLSLVNRRRD